MRPTMSRITKSLATLCVAAAVVAPGAGAQNGQDLRSPDATDGAVAVAPGQDMRSPDASDQFVNTQSGSYAPAPSDSSSGSNWDTVGILAGGVLLACALGFGLFAVSRRRRRHEPRIPAISS